MLNTKGPNQSFGNHILHLFGCWKISKKLGLSLSINCNSNLDELFILDKFKNKSDSDPILIYTEKHGGNLEDHVKKEIENNIFFSELLNGNMEIPDSFCIKGWFWNSIFLPGEDIFEDISINPELINMTIEELPFIKEDSCLVIHYRGTDFSNHSIGWGDLRLKSEYYEKCISDFIEKNSIEKIVIISDDNPDFLIDLCKKYSKKIIFNRNNYIIDWLSILLCKNLICSNSSFCYTSGWYKKNNIYQPNKFFTRYIKTDLHYPVFPYYENIKNKRL